MARIIIIYESKWGNTRIVAENISDGIKLGAPVEVVVKDVKNTDPTELAAYDAILIGSPNHMGGATRKINGLVNDLGKMHLEGKSIAFFDTYLGGDYQKTSNKMAAIINRNAPGMKLVTPGLSILVSGMKGPVSESELAKCKEFGTKFAAQFRR